MFAIHDVYLPVTKLPKIDGPVRVIETVELEKVILIEVGKDANSVPFSIDYRDWLEYLDSDALLQVEDPDLALSSTPTNLPKAAANRYKNIVKATERIAQNPHLLHSPTLLAKTIAETSKSMGVSERTIKRWVCDWLRAGRNPSAAVRSFLEKDSEQLIRPQKRGGKRGISM